MSVPDELGVLQKIASYYTEKVEQHGPTPRGVDWNSSEAQSIRFEQITKVVPLAGSYSIADYGCGYGALFDFLSAAKRRPDLYEGYDVSAAMIDRARRIHEDEPNCVFTTSSADLVPADCTVASGIFSVRMDFAVQAWEAYVFETLDKMRSLSRKAFSFNMLTAYSDPERMRADLYYADPHRYFDYCRTRFARNVALLHDYGLYEFTVLVRLDA